MKNSSFLFEELGLASTLTELGIDDKHLALMTEKACGDGVLHGYRDLTPTDVQAILESCL